MVLGRSSLDLLHLGEECRRAARRLLEEIGVAHGTSTDVLPLGAGLQRAQLRLLETVGVVQGGEVECHHVGIVVAMRVIFAVKVRPVVVFLQARAGRLQTLLVTTATVGRGEDETVAGPEKIVAIGTAGHALRLTVNGKDGRGRLAHGATTEVSRQLLSFERCHAR